jgi:hypothetical protein
MTPTWHVRRQGHPTPAALGQWDRVYQSLVRWGLGSFAAQMVPLPGDPPLKQEVSDAYRTLCPGLDLASGPDGHH